MSLERVAELGHRILLNLPPEFSHRVGIEVMKRLAFSPPGPCINPDFRPELFGIKFDNPLGLAAGFDKYAEIVEQSRDYGFAWIEEGSFTYCGGNGNSGRRLFRFKQQKSLANRMGLNCDPAEEAADKLSRLETPFFSVNIAKTHDPNIVGDEAIDDVVGSYELLKNLGIYTVINISCPNTREGKTFEEPNSLRDLLLALHQVGKGKPLLVKLSPSLSGERLNSIVYVAESFVDGYVCGNTMPSDHPSVKWIYDEYGKCGVSGALLEPYAFSLIREVRAMTSKPIIGCGGISTGGDAFLAMRAGATAVQAYTGFIYRGRDFAHKLNQELSAIKNKSMILV